MTPDDILAQLPNGMHDASISEMHVEFGREQVTLDMEFWVGDLDSDDEVKREAYSIGKLRLAGVVAMVVDPPDPADRSSCFSLDTGLNVHGEFGTYPGEAPAPDDGLTSTPTQSNSMPQDHARSRTTTCVMRRHENAPESRMLDPRCALTASWGGHDDSGSGRLGPGD